MHDSKLFRLLKILDTAELKRLHAFLKSPFYNTKPDVVKLYILLRGEHPGYTSAKLTKERVYKKLFPGREYEYQKLLNLMSDFTTLLESYLLALQLEKDAVEQGKLLLRAYAERPDCYDLFEKKARTLGHAFDTQPYLDDHYFLEKMQLQLLYCYHPGTDLLVNGQEALRSAAQHFGDFKTLMEARLNSALHAWAQVAGESKSIDHFGSEMAKGSPVLVLYKKLNELQYAPEAAGDLQGLVLYFLEHISGLRPSDRSNILKILLNDTLTLVNQGRNDFHRISLTLYQTGLENDCLTVYGKLKKATFHNIVSIGLLCGELEWTKNFMEKYKLLLDGNAREEALALGQAAYSFEKKDFEKVIQLMQLSFQNPQDIFKSKTFLIRAKFELFWQHGDDPEMLFAQLDAFEKFTRRNRKIAPARLEEGLKFIAFTRKMVAMKWNKRGRELLKLEIMQEPRIAFKSWLLEKIG